jgi:sterol desaturase/sphingolipid hydroxylase (fatty acid hydroxylase superfamily)
MDLHVLAPAIIAGFALLVIALERRFPYDRGQPFFRRGFWVDLLGYTLLQSYLLGLAIEWLVGAMDRASGLSRLHLVSAWPIPVQLGFFLITHDLYIYSFHRWMHFNKYLWRIHEAHHSVKEVDWLAGSRSHALEILINQTIEYAPIVLLGAHPSVALLKGLVDACWGMWIHSNVGVRTGWLQRIINGPEMHRWHHSNHFLEGGVNFATKFAWWDWLLGTAYLPAGQRPPGYGLSGGVRFPEGFAAQQLAAFRPFDEPAKADGAEPVGSA